MCILETNDLSSMFSHRQGNPSSGLVLGFFCPGQLHHYLYPVLLVQDAPSPHLFGQENCLQLFWLDCVCLSEPLDGSH